MTEIATLVSPSNPMLLLRAQISSSLEKARNQRDTAILFSAP